MKKIALITLIVIFTNFNGNAQHLEIGFGLGTGATYLIENGDESVDINYAAPFSSYIDLKYSKEDRYFGVKVRFQYTNTGIEGEDWKISNGEIDGEVAALTTMFLLEHVSTKRSWNFGYNFGVGYTRERIRQRLKDSPFSVESKYLSFNASGIVSKKIGKNLIFRIEQVFLWTDPINSLRGKTYWQIAGEDISAFIQLGITYKIN